MASNRTSSRPKRLGRAALALAFLVGILLVTYRVTDVWASRAADAHPASNRVGSARTAVLLVNADRPLPDNYRTPRLVSLMNRVPVSSSKVKVAAAAEQPLRDLFRNAKRAGFKQLYVASGYRDRNEQQRLWDAADDKSYVQRPGHSEHQTGLAVDLVDLTLGQDKFGGSRPAQWLADNSWRYGFILRYPAGKEAITGIAHEPWHFRYVGKAIARACHDGGLALEEYVAGQ